MHAKNVLRGLRALRERTNAPIAMFDTDARSADTASQLMDLLSGKSIPDEEAESLGFG